MNFTNNMEKPEDINNWEDFSVHPDKSALTVEKLCSFDGLETIGQNEAETIILSVNKLCAIIYDFMTLSPFETKIITMNTNIQNIAA